MYSMAIRLNIDSQHDLKFSTTEMRTEHLCFATMFVDKSSVMEHLKSHIISHTRLVLKHSYLVIRNMKGGSPSFLWTYLGGFWKTRWPIGTRRSSAIRVVQVKDILIIQYPVQKAYGLLFRLHSWYGSWLSVLHNVLCPISPAQEDQQVQVMLLSCTFFPGKARGATLNIFLYNKALPNVRSTYSPIVSSVCL